MKFEVKKRGTKEFYDEMLYVISYYKKFIKKPKRKAYQYTKYLLMYITLSIIMCGAFIYLYFLDKDWYSLVMIGAFLIVLFLSIIIYVSAKKRIKMYMEDMSDKSIEITEEAICYNSETLNMKIKKEEISVIVINKYSICILPKEITTYAISISKDYLNEFLSGANENGYEKLIANND